MGLGDLFKRGKKMAMDNTDQVKEGIEKAGDLVDEKTGGKYAEHVDKGQEAATEFVDKLDEED